MLTISIQANVTSNLLIQNDDCGGRQQFYMEYLLQFNLNYILVVTTWDSNVTGAYSIQVVGPAAVSLR